MKKFLKGFGIFVLTDLLLVLTIALLLILPIKKSINNNVIKEMVYSLDLEQMAQDSPKLQEELNKNLEPIYNETRKIGIPDEVVVKIMNIKEVKELVSDATNNLIIAFLTGENQKLINNENINNVLNNAIDDINTKGIYEISDDTKQEIIDIGNDIYEEYQDYVIDTDTILKGACSKSIAILYTSNGRAPALFL